MPNHNAKNERIKRLYFTYLKEAKRHNEVTEVTEVTEVSEVSEVTGDAVAKALARFEDHTKFHDFGLLHVEQAVAFKKHLAGQPGDAHGRPPGPSRRGGRGEA